MRHLSNVARPTLRPVIKDAKNQIHTCGTPFIAVIERPRPAKYVDWYLLNGLSASPSAALFEMSTRTVPWVTCEVYGAGMGFPTVDTFHSRPIVIVMGDSICESNYRCENNNNNNNNNNNAIHLYRAYTKAPCALQCDA